MVAAIDGRGMEILRYLAQREARGIGPPSVREVATAAGLKSAKSAHTRLAALEGAGFVERGEAPSRKRRGIKLTTRGWEAVGEAPLLGRIAAGRGLEAVADEEAYSLGGELLLPRSGRRRYLLRVVGDSMIEAHIADGDLLVVEEDEAPADGEVVVALLRDGEEVTVKKLRRQGETVRLEPRNGEHEDIVIQAGDVAFQGRVIWVIHPPRR